jgi:hypothetical protein
MGLIGDITPLQDSDDYSFGYCQGQRLAHTAPHLRGNALARTGLRLWQSVSKTVALERDDYIQGVVDGHCDELAGLSHPLPRTN